MKCEGPKLFGLAQFVHEVWESALPEVATPAGPGRPPPSWPRRSALGSLRESARARSPASSPRADTCCLVWALRSSTLGWGEGGDHRRSTAVGHLGIYSSAALSAVEPSGHGCGRLASADTSAVPSWTCGVETELGTLILVPPPTLILTLSPR